MLAFKLPILDKLDVVVLFWFYSKSASCRQSSIIIHSKRNLTMHDKERLNTKNKRINVTDYTNLDESPLKGTGRKMYRESVRHKISAAEATAHVRS